MSKPRPAPGETTTLDVLMAGKLRIRQPVEGHRGGTDTLLLAAAAPANAGVLVDLGAGVGTAGLAVARRGACTRAILVEIQPALCELARENAAANGLDAIASVICTDALTATGRRAGGLENGLADTLISNPPYLTAGRSQTSPDHSRALAHTLHASGLEGWLRAAAALLRPGGALALIHRTDCLDAILTACAGRFGGLQITPVYPRDGAPSHRVIVRGIKGSRAPLAMAPGLILHSETGGFTPQAAALHAGEAILPG